MSSRHALAFAQRSTKYFIAAMKSSFTKMRSSSLTWSPSFWLIL